MSGQHVAVSEEGEREKCGRWNVALFIRYCFCICLEWLKVAINTSVRAVITA